MFRPPAGEQPGGHLVEIKSFPPMGTVVEVRQFLERTESDAERQLAAGDSEIIPGDRGKVGPGWLVRSLFKPVERRVAEAEITSSSGGVRALPVTRFRSCAARSDKKPFRAGSSNRCRFRAPENRSYPEGIWLLLRTSTVAEGSPFCPSDGTKNTPNRVTKRVSAPGRPCEATQDTFRNAGDLSSGTAGLPAKSSLRVKRPDPSHRANAPTSVGGRPGGKRSRRGPAMANVS
jgi:hypothetical protein